MNRISFNNLKFPDKPDNFIIDFFDNKIEILRYLPVTDKKDLIQITMQKSFEDGLFNNILLDIYFHLNIVYLYTNIEFSEDDRADEFSLFDQISQSGLMDYILNTMDNNEYNYLYDTLNKEITNYMTYKNSAAAVLQSVIQDLPKNAAIANDIVQNWDLNKFQNIQDMLQVANATGMNNANPQMIAEAAPADNVVDFLEEQAKLDNQE